MQIVGLRNDLSPDLIHLTRRRIRGGNPLNAMDVLKRILTSGHLKPAFGQRFRGHPPRWKPTIHGELPAVCFTEQPLHELPATIQALPNNYEGYGLIFDKRYVYHWGGRPVMYGDDSLWNVIPKSHEYLWSLFDPNRTWNGRTWPSDWTHEREWRFKLPEDYHPREMLPGFPLHDFYWGQRPDCPSFRVLVREKRERIDMTRFLDRVRQRPPAVHETKLIQDRYVHGIEMAEVISLDEL